MLPIAQRGAYGKPRPAVIVQTDRATGTDSVIVCMLSSDLSPPSPLRVRIEPDETTGLKRVSDIMADKVTIVPRDKCGEVFGRVPQLVMDELEQALVFVLGLGD